MTEDQRAGIVAMANELHRQADDLRRCDPDQDVKDCERRIDKLCSIVQGVVLLVRSVAEKP